MKWGLARRLIRHRDVSRDPYHKTPSGRNSSMEFGFGMPV